MLDRRAQGGEQEIRLGLRRGRAERMGGQHDEFVAAEPGDQVIGLDMAAEPRRRLDQQGIAGIMAERVVDRFEIVEIDQEEVDASARSETGRGLLQPLLEEQAVGQLGSAHHASPASAHAPRPPCAR